MITISAEWLKEQWPVLNASGLAPVSLSKWDDGDAYTLVSLGPMSGTNVVRGVVVMESTSAPEVQVVIRLRRVPGGRPDQTVDLFNLSDGTCYRVEGQIKERDVARVVQVQVVGVKETLEKRRKSLIESHLLQEVSVLVIGLGTGGAQTAVELAKSGVGNFILVDSDRLDIGNVTRHNAGISHAGRRKVYVARDLLLEKNPSVVVRTFPISADWNSYELICQMVREANLVLCATDSRKSKLFINHICVKERKTAIYGGAFTRAYGGQVLRVRPGRSPCYQCFVMGMPEQEADYEISSEAQAQEIAYADHPVAVEPGLSIDVAPISIMMAKLALQELIDGKESTLHVLDKDFTAPWYLWLNRPEPKTAYASLPPLSESSDEMTILRWYGVELEREKSCHVCGDFGRAARETYGFEAGELPVLQEGPLPAGVKLEEE
jgi:molybdopterin/thiamine biosynthesis adenylyltransferase